MKEIEKIAHLFVAACLCHRPFLFLSSSSVISLLFALCPLCPLVYLATASASVVPFPSHSSRRPSPRFGLFLLS